MVVPFMDLTTSPGLAAPPSGMFSQVATTATKLTGNFAFAAAMSVPITVAAPHISYFISSIASPGFNEIPPLSKVKPLPTNTMGSADLSAAPKYLSSTNLGSWILPFATPQNEGIFSRI